VWGSATYERKSDKVAFVQCLGNHPQMLGLKIAMYFPVLSSQFRGGKIARVHLILHPLAVAKTWRVEIRTAMTEIRRFAVSIFVARRSFCRYEAELRRELH
jgi:hypothetical protein